MSEIVVLNTVSPACGLANALISVVVKLWNLTLLENILVVSVNVTLSTLFELNTKSSLCSAKLNFHSLSVTLGATVHSIVPVEP